MILKITGPKTRQNKPIAAFHYEFSKEKETNHDITNINQ